MPGDLVKGTSIVRITLEHDLRGRFAAISRAQDEALCFVKGEILSQNANMATRKLPIG